MLATWCGIIAISVSRQSSTDVTAMKRVNVLAAFLLAIIAFPATASAEAVTDGSTGMVSTTFEDLFRVRGWCGEEVVVTGTRRILFAATATPTGRIAVTGRSIVTNATGVGLTTGDTYRLVESNGSTFQLEEVVEPFVETRVATVESTLVFIGGGHIFRVRSLEHVTISPTGEVVAGFEMLDSECRLIGDGARFDAGSV
jgi:hypothetical protein